MDNRRGWDKSKRREPERQREREGETDNERGEEQMVRWGTGE